VESEGLVTYLTPTLSTAWRGGLCEEALFIMRRTVSYPTPFLPKRKGPGEDCLEDLNDFACSSDGSPPLPLSRNFGQEMEIKGEAKISCEAANK
jgi:hypothetical protein